MSKQLTYQDRIVSDPHICAGKPVIKGTRISVDILLARLGVELDINRLLKNYPRLTKDDIQAALFYAGAALRRNTKESHLSKSKYPTLAVLAGAAGKLKKPLSWQEMEDVVHDEQAVA